MTDRKEDKPKGSPPKKPELDEQAIAGIGPLPDDGKARGGKKQADKPTKPPPKPPAKVL